MKRSFCLMALLLALLLAAPAMAAPQPLDYLSKAAETVQSAHTLMAETVRHNNDYFGAKSAERRAKTVEEQEDDLNNYVDWETAFAFFTMLALCMCVFPITAIFAILCSPCLMIALVITGVGYMRAADNLRP